MPLTQFDDPSYDVEYLIRRAEAQVQSLDPEALSRPVHQLRQEAAQFTGNRDILQQDVRDRVALFNRMFNEHDSITAYDNHRFIRAHRAAQPVEARQSYDEGAEAARLLFEVEESATQLIRAAHRWLDDKGHRDFRLRSASTPAIGATTLSCAIWDTRNQDEHWSEPQELGKKVQATLFAVVAVYPGAFGTTPPAIEPDLRRHSLAAEMCFDVLGWRQEGTTMAALSSISDPTAAS